MKRKSTYKNANDEASRHELQRWKSSQTELVPSEPPPSVYAILAESDFAWSDDSWDPMTTEWVSLASTETLAKRLISRRACGSSPRSSSGRTTHDYREVPLTSDCVSWREVSSVFVVFETIYESITHYNDMHGRAHVSYRDDASGTPLHAFIDEPTALAAADSLSMKYRKESPRKKSPFFCYSDRDDENESEASACPFVSAGQLAELSSLEPAEFYTAFRKFSDNDFSQYREGWFQSPRQQLAYERLSDFFDRRRKFEKDVENARDDSSFNWDDIIEQAKSDPLCGEMWKNYTAEELRNVEFVWERLRMDLREQPEESKRFDDLAREIWNLMDRVVLFKVVRMSIDDHLAINPH